MRDGVPVAPFASVIDISFDITDNDGVTFPANPFVIDDIAFPAGNSEQRWGRLKVDNAFGSELIDLAAPLHGEFYKGATFVMNTDDDCPMLSLATEVDVSNPASGTRNGGQSMIIGAGTTSVTSGDPSLANGVDSMIFSALVTGNTGSVDMLVDVVAGSKYWLQYDWDGDGNHDNDPTGRVSFGLFTRRATHIHCRAGVSSIRQG